jgi:phage structural protein
MAIRENGFDNVWRPWRYLVQQSKTTNNSDYVALLKSESEPTPWRDLPLQNGWQHHPDYSRAQYSKSFDGVVYLRGTIYKGRTTKETAILNLPEDVRPKQDLFATAINSNYGMAVLGLYPTGNVVVKSNIDSTWLNLDNISFKI